MSSRAPSSRKTLRFARTGTPRRFGNSKRGSNKLTSPPIGSRTVKISTKGRPPFCRKVPCGDLPLLFLTARELALRSRPDWGGGGGGRECRTTRARPQPGRRRLVLGQQQPD